MTSSFVESLPEAFVANTTAICGQKGRHWLNELPELIKGLESRWSIQAGDPFEGIEYNYVARATLAEGTPAVMKIGIPQEQVEIFGEAKYLRTMDGRRCVRLLAEDREEQAILIERVLPGGDLPAVFQHRPVEATESAVELLRSIRASAPADRTDTVSLDGWFSNLKRAANPDFAGCAAKALEIYERLSRQSDRIGYLHGDFHGGNIVLAGDTWIVLDPKGVIGHVGYEIAVFLLNLYWWQSDSDDLDRTLAAAIGLFSDATGIPTLEIREWAYAQTVLSAWWTFNEMPDQYDNQVATADIWGIL